MFGSAFQNKPAMTKEQFVFAEAARPDRLEYLGAKMGQGWDESLPGRAAEEAAVYSAEKDAGTFDTIYSHASNDPFVASTMEVQHSYAMSEDEWKNSQHYRDGMSYRSDMTPERAKVMAEYYDDRRARESIIAAGDEYYGLGMKALGFGATMLGALPDPVNFISFGSGALVGAATTGVRQLAGMGMRQAVMQGVKKGAAVGAMENVIGTSLENLFIYPDLNSRGEHLGFADYMTDIAMSAVFGGLLGSAGGALGSWHSKRQADAQQRTIDRAREIADRLQAEAEAGARWRDSQEQRLNDAMAPEHDRQHLTLDNDFLWRAGDATDAQPNTGRMTDFADVPDADYLAGFGVDAPRARDLPDRIFTDTTPEGDVVPVRRRRDFSWEAQAGEWRQAMIDSGFTPEEADANVRILGAVAELQAEMHGIDPREWIARQLQVSSVADGSALRAAQEQFFGNGNQQPQLQITPEQIGNFLNEASANIGEVGRTVLDLMRNNGLADVARLAELPGIAAEVRRLADAVANMDTSRSLADLMGDIVLNVNQRNLLTGMEALGLDVPSVQAALREIAPVFDDVMARIDGAAQNTGTLWQSVDASIPQESIDVVRTQYEGTAAWMKAPNGQPTKLTERQWLQVRTPEFKAWFGDWEVSNAFNFAVYGDPVVKLTGKEFQKDGVPLTTKVPDFYQKKYNGVVKNRELGAVNLDREGVKDSLAHRLWPAKSAAYAAVPEIVKNGVVFDRQKNWKGRGWDTFVLVAPIEINGVKYAGEVIVKRLPNRQGLYVHGVEIAKRLEGALQTPTQGRAPQALDITLGDKLEAVKNASKVVDENGEPRVMYHQTDAKDLQVFNPYWGGAGTTDTETPNGIFMKPDDSDIGLKGKEQMALFTNIKTPVSFQNRFALREYLKQNVPGYADAIAAYDKKIKDYAVKYDEADAQYFAKLKELREQNPGLSRPEINALYKELPDASDAVLDEWQAYDREESQRIKEMVDDHFRQSGYDGIVLKADEGGAGKKTTQAFIAFDPNQVKSATDNIGTFDANRPNTLYQTDAEAKGAYNRRADGAALISLFQNKADLSTIIHEGAGHHFLENIREAAQSDTAPDWVKQGWRDIAEAIGADADPTKAIATDAHEKFAKMAEDYIGKAMAPKGAEPLLKRFVQWMVDIYKAILGTKDADSITPGVRAVFDRLLAKEREIRGRHSALDNDIVNTSRSEAGDMMRASLAGRDRRDIMRAMELAIQQMEAGEAVDVSAILRGTGIEERLANNMGRDVNAQARPDYRTEQPDAVESAPPIERYETDSIDADVLTPERQAELAQLIRDGRIDPELQQQIGNLQNERERVANHSELGQSIAECVFNAAA